mmetsp:Transcript_26975/g.40957  ORF Transcript_26975/g.40957 Transcript_26975/m.40957 type:complete len:357 (-) Transcript_26975:1315-2385(-)|eukprot:CAMPEP_0194239522 /NCGR_PEP_ID=MMETSP0158-20130606/5949_1 /TAXON_ID=33649 /ORGANISM="Thalassionema nitzschioides, Strain L26-B" /LENGTH=356 /DNA_ID=CAMNT_0038974009 /DNA_START=143 /DNA_END=1213 /DNA_ORIENTATION=+
MTESENSPLLLENETYNAVIKSMEDYARARKLLTLKVFMTLLIAGLALTWTTRIDSRNNPLKGSSSGGAEIRFDLDSFIHSFERENAMKMSLQVPNYQYEEGSLNHLLYFNQTHAFEDLKTDDQSSALDFFNYIQGGWEAQINQGFCPIASSAAILNSLRGRIELPQDPVYIPFPWATQNHLVQNDCVKQNVVDVDNPKKFYVGMSLNMAKDLLNCQLSGQGYVAEAYHVDPDLVSEDEVKKIVKDAVMDKNSRVMINYDRGGIGQGPMGHGHFSPIGAYNHQLNAFLVMDVAKYKFPPVWVPVSNLYHGVGSIDTCANVQYPDYLLDWHSMTYSEIIEELECQPKFRGIIVVKKL